MGNDNEDTFEIYYSSSTCTLFIYILCGTWWSKVNLHYRFALITEGYDVSDCGTLYYLNTSWIGVVSDCLLGIQILSPVSMESVIIQLPTL